MTLREASKVPAITLGFWVIKILATTLGETGGDAASMQFNLGYLLSTALFGLAFIVLVAAQIRAHGFHPLLYWAVIVATTTAGTTLADFADRSLGIGYPGGTAILFTLVLAVLGLWWRAEGTVSVRTIARPRVEMFYWATILASNTLGTALGDWAAGSGLGYEGGALMFAGLIALVVAAHVFTRISGTLLFWAAFILTRPLGATAGDLLDKPVASGGLNLNRLEASAALTAVILALLLILPQRAGGHPGEATRTA